ncbi:MAG: hypothetical protein GF334_02085 [Candidatus Altiarchaeales archaeon]|nr:hypothetical protein [Candidatus Altiarchaeales archaeon]
MRIDIEVPDGVCGDYEVKTFEISEEQAKLNNLRAAVNSSTRPILPGTYKRLTRKGLTVMSNTPLEIQDHLEFMEKAHGRVLINGLGLGMALKAILEKDDLVSATVIEISSEVIKLVGPTYTDPRVEIINVSAFDYRPPKGRHYQAVWHDIWDDICGDNIPEMNRLHRKYRGKTDWQSSWCRRECLKANRRMW